MGTVTGYTAERMKAIEDASVVNGEIDPASGHLILTRFDESTIDAGLVVTSPKVVTSSTRPTGAALFAGLVIYETDTKLFWSYNGVGWTPHGGVFHCTAATRPAAPVAGMEIFETDTKRKYRYADAAWNYLDGGTNPTYARATASGWQALGGPGFATITLDVEQYDYGNNFAANAYTVPQTGMYDIRAQATLALNNNPQRAILCVLKNGGDWLRGTGATIRGGSGLDPWDYVLSELVPCTVGDVLRLAAYNGQATGMQTAGGPWPTLTIQKVP